jgi:GTP-binding protein
MQIREIQFVSSSASADQCPPPVYPEYAFTGRSNVGKSSLINFLVNRKKLAYTSSTPGKTQLINHFLINGSWYLVDLPGYGYARTSKKKRDAWPGLINNYIHTRTNLMSLFVLIDSRHPDLKNDMDYLTFLGQHAIPFVIVFTKTDKITTYQLEKNLAFFKKEMLQFWEEVPQIFTTSAIRREGREEILTFIESVNPLFKKSEKQSF